MMLQNRPIGIIVLRFSDDTFIDVNTEFLQIYGYAREDVIGKTYAELGLWDAPECREHIIASLFQKGVMQSFRMRLEPAFGDCKNLAVAMYTSEINGELCLLALVADGADAGGELAAGLENQLNGPVSRAIFESAGLAAGIAEPEKEFAHLYDQAPFGYHFADANGVFLWVNATELAWLGYRKDEVIGKMKVSDFYTPAYDALFKQDFSLAEHGGAVSNKEYDLVCRDKSLKRAILNVTEIKDQAGKLLHSRTVAHDISELKAAQEKLKQTTLKQQAMLDNQLVGMVKTRDYHIITWKNSAIERIFGYEAAELQAKSTRILYPDDAAYLNMANSAYPIIEEQGIYRAQFEMVRKNGEKVWVDISGMLLNQNEIIWTLTDISNIMQYQVEIESIAFHDALTGLPNRRLVSDRLGQALAQAKRSNQLLAVCYLDLDGFKPVNDQFGHEAGDKLLKVITRRMQESVRQNDTVGRLGGDEFVLLLTSLSDVVELQIVLERVLDLINQPIALKSAGTGSVGADPIDLMLGQTQRGQSRQKSIESAPTDSKVTVGASIGVSLFPRDSDDPDILLRYADHAMYQAKKAGRNRVHLFCADNV